MNRRTEHRVDDWYQGQEAITRPDRLLENPGGPLRHEPALRRRFRIEERRAHVAQLKKGGATQREIAQLLGVSLGTVNSDVQALVERWKREQLLDTHAERLLDLQRVEGMYTALIPAMERGHPPSVEAALKVLRHKAELLGYSKTPLDGQGPVETIDQLIEQVIVIIGQPVVDLLADAPDDADALELVERHFGDRPEVRRLLEGAGGAA